MFASPKVLFPDFGLAHERTREAWTRLSDFWCFLMHSDTSWPMNGHYQCTRCKRIYRIPWDNR